MKYYSTNGNSEAVGPREAILCGLASDGGLFMPEEIPLLPKSIIAELANLSLSEIASVAAQPFLAPDFPEASLQTLSAEAFNFPAPLHQLDERLFVFELFHGPTLAFKDFGARFMARVISYFIRNETRELNILVATSGDTGSAVADGFFGVPGTRVVLLYPQGKVSKLQEKQFATLGGNVCAYEVSGSFDDCQRLVKKAFVDRDLRGQMQLASANSINIARLIPQSFYYLYLSGLLAKQGIQAAAISVPSGNFGNLTAGIIARKMGAPLETFIAATNANSTVCDYLAGGSYEERPSISTLSNAMDVGAPSNFARLNALCSGERSKMASMFSAASFSDQLTLETIRGVNSNYLYQVCPHTAVGICGLEEFYPRSPGVALGTAHPAKFLDALKLAGIELSELPFALARLEGKEKQSKPLAASYEEFREVLLALN